MTWHRIGPASSLAPGDRRAVRIEHRELVVCRVGDAFYAVAGRCTHAAWPLAEEPVEGEEIVCTLHGARFDLRDGCPTAGPASKPLATYPVELRDGSLFVGVRP